MVISNLEEIKCILKSLVLSCPSKITIERLNCDFKRSEGYWIPYRTFGYRNLELFLCSLLDTLVISGFGPTAKVGFVSNHKLEHIDQMICKQKNTKYERIPTVLKKLPTTIRFIGGNLKPYAISEKQSSSQKPLQTQQESFSHKKYVHGETNNFEQTDDGSNNKYSHRSTNETNKVSFSTRDAVIQCRQIKKCEKEASVEEVKHAAESKITEEPCKTLSYDVSATDFFKVSSDVNNNTNDFNEAVPDFAANSLVFQIDFPENSANFGDRFESYKIPNELHEGAVIKIFIAEIHNPYKFWFHIAKQNHELDLLMNRIERFYTSLDVDEFQIHISCIIPGQVCAALYKNSWHRAKILTPVINNKTKVFFVDYGTVSEVAANDIKYLLTKFASTTAQALRGCLSHIKPKGRHWSHQATNEFLSMVSELLLFAQITEIDTTTKVTQMILCDTNANVTIQINKTLVEKGVALFDNKWGQHNKFEHGKRIRHPREEFPTFEMIEKGEYPSLSELTQLMCAGIDYEGIIDRMFYHPGRLLQEFKEFGFPLLITNPFKYDIIDELCRSLKHSES